ncbi:conserved hypothetical protein [Sporisorium reilianum SRZ2]|uniref:Uncharacterized protein n=1 Tax=Sporisorium reilianum (strain SRZ2) TaxID=999809 RepID=E6ZUW6_SPORE|nr:conserved hypothetical protein [Sporisorium reilianum SRZ2]
MRLQATADMLGYVLLLLVLALQPASGAGGDDKSNLPQIISDPSAGQSFAERYGFLAPDSRLSRSGTYAWSSAHAVTYLDDDQFYNKKFKTIRNRGLRRLSHTGHITSASKLRSHPDFVNFFDGHSYTPAVYQRVAEILPDNPLGEANPDVAIFMHRISRVVHQTVVEQSLELKQIIRGTPSRRSSSDGLAYQVAWQNPGSDKPFLWMSDLKEVFKWPVLPDLERLGYNPSTIEEEIGVYSRTKGQYFYSHSSRYIRRFDLDSRVSEQYFNTFALMFSPVDDAHLREPWFHAPLYKTFNAEAQDIVLIKYPFRGRLFPDLDRVRFILSTKDPRNPVLVPVGIVRPVQITPEVRFKTVYTFPSKLREEGAVSFSRIRPSTVRMVPDTDGYVQKHNGPFRDYLFGEARPYGHPLYYIGSRAYVREFPPAADARAVVASHNAATSSSQERSIPGRFAEPKVESPPTYTDQLLSQDQHAATVPRMPGWQFAYHQTPVQHLQEEAAHIDSRGKNPASKVETSGSGGILGKRPLLFPQTHEPAAIHPFPQDQAHTYQSYAGQRVKVEPTHAEQPIDPRAYMPSHAEHSHTSMPAVQQGSMPVVQRGSTAAQMVPSVDVIHELEQHLTPEKWLWHY